MNPFCAVFACAGALLRRTQTPLLRTKTSAMPRGSNGSASTFACLQTVAKRGAADEPFFNNVGGGWLLTVDGKPLFYKLHMCSSRGDCNRGQRLLARAQGRRSSVRHARRPRSGSVTRNVGFLTFFVEKLLAFCVIPSAFV